MSKHAIKVISLSKNFVLPHAQSKTLKSSVLSLFRSNLKIEKQQALKDVSFNVKEGEFFGIVGRNGSGKSTLLKLLANIYVPDGGGVEINGRLTPFIELGVGFNQELTGRENVYLNGALLGFSRKEMEVMYDSIVEFAEIEDFMDQKLKNYSSGMQVRLAFSIAIRAETEILLLDEVLAVGDAAFQRKCYDHFMKLKKDKRTVVLVTHDMAAVRQYCDRAVMIDSGEVVKEGSPERVAQAYQKLFSDEAQKGKGHNVGTDRWGNGKVKATNINIATKDDFLYLACTFRASSDVEPPVFGFTVFNGQGANILESNTQRMNVKTKNMKKGASQTIKWQIPNIFSSGTHTVTIASCDRSNTEFYDWWNDAIEFTISKDSTTASLTDPKIRTIQ